VRKASAVIVPNAVGAEQVRRWFDVGAERILELAHPTPAVSADGPPERRARPYLLYPAQLWPHKDHATLLHALSELPGYELVLPGSDKGTGGHLRDLAARLGVAERVEFLGFVPGERLAALYRGAHALAYPSRFGPENLPPLEALAYGCPPIVADVDGFREQLGAGALFVAPGDARGFAQAAVALEDGARRAAVVRAGREHTRAATAEGYVAAVLAWIDGFEATVRLWN